MYFAIAFKECVSSRKKSHLMVVVDVINKRWLKLIMKYHSAWSLKCDCGLNCPRFQLNDIFLSMRFDLFEAE